MTSLAAQLQAVASAVPREEKLKGKASLLYDIREAADIDLATIYAVGVQGASPRRRARRSRRRRFTPADTSLGWRARRDGDAAPVESPLSRADARSTCRGTPEPEPRPSNDRRRARARDAPTPPERAPSLPVASSRRSHTTRSCKNNRLLRERRREFPSRARAVSNAGFTELCRSDGRFEAYQKPLFSRAASETNRELQDKAFNDRLNVSLEGFLRLLSGRFATAAAARCLEYLIRRFKIHVYNVEAAVTCALPYHATAEFVKLVQLAHLEGTSFYWLKGVKEKGAAPPRDGLVARCARDGAFLGFVCEAAAASAGAKVRTRVFFRLFSSLTDRDSSS